MPSVRLREEVRCVEDVEGAEGEEGAAWVCGGEVGGDSDGGYSSDDMSISVSAVA
jgi:hypothetical protein